MDRSANLFKFLTRHALLDAQTAQRAVTAAFPERANQARIVYIAHPIGGDVAANMRHLREVLRRINHRYTDVVPFCPYYADVVSLDDHDPDDRARGLRNREAVIRSGMVDECWLTGGKLTAGMLREIEMFDELGIPVIDHLTTHEINS
jgi:hypothetical protein